LNWGTGFPLRAMNSPTWSFSSKTLQHLSCTEPTNLCMAEYSTMFCLRLT
jgi:hypothetical protein